MLRLNKLISRETMFKLYTAFIIPHFYYCSSVWHFCGARNTEKLDTLNKRILRFILKDYRSSYSQLLEKINLTSLRNKWLQSTCMLIVLYKSLFVTDYPNYMRDMFTLRAVNYNLRGNYILSLPKPRTTTYGLNSFWTPWGLENLQGFWRIQEECLKFLSILILNITYYKL